MSLWSQIIPRPTLVPSGCIVVITWCPDRALLSTLRIPSFLDGVTWSGRNPITQAYYSSQVTKFQATWGLQVLENRCNWKRMNYICEVCRILKYKSLLQVNSILAIPMVIHLIKIIHLDFHCVFFIIIHENCICAFSALWRILFNRTY